MKNGTTYTGKIEKKSITRRWYSTFVIRQQTIEFNRTGD